MDKKNKPQFKKIKKIKLPKRILLEQFIPIKDWFLTVREINSIHGMRHILRVAINFVLIANIIFNKKRFKNFIIAAVLHDIRRKNDKGDCNHGDRAARWFKKNIVLIEKMFKIKLKNIDIEEIYWSIFFHELPIEKLNINYYKFKTNIDIIKFADALDRYRLPQIKWWLNENLLGFKIPTSFKKIAFNLVIRSEQNFLNGKSSIESVLSILK